MSKTFAELSNDSFRELSELRKKRIAEASSETPKEFHINEIAKQLHPDRQYMKIAEIKELAGDTKCFRFVPDPDRGTTMCAPFRAGQYLSVYLDIEGVTVTRAYSISSSPKAAKEGYYELTLKYVEDGLVSRWTLDNWKVGDEVTLSGPQGTFKYSRLRDAKTVIGIAGGSGITPFLSMAQAIVDGDEAFNMILLYGSRKEDGILYKAEFDALEAASCGRVKVVHVLSDEEKEGFEHGFVTADLIKKYAPDDAPYSIFICGPQAMYEFVDKEIAKLGLERKFVRHELFGEVHGPAKMSDYPGAEDGLDMVKITVSIQDETRTVSGSVNDSILQILEKNGISVPSSCRSGECGFCRSFLKSGRIYVPKVVDGRRLADFKFGGIHPCVTFPLSDIEIEVPYSK